MQNKRTTVQNNKKAVLFCSILYYVNKYNITKCDMGYYLCISQTVILVLIIFA